MTKKQIARSIAFLLVICCMVYLFCDVFEQDSTTNYSKRLYTYRKLNDDTIDAVWIGTSGVDRFWIAPKAYEEYGMTVYPLSSDALPSWLYLTMIQEAYTYQDPELIIIDIRPFTQSNIDKDIMEVRARRVLDAMQFGSPNWFKAVFRTTRALNDKFKKEKIVQADYLLPFVKYHSKWAEDDFSLEGALGDDLHEYGGFYVSSVRSLKKRKQKKVVYDTVHYETLDTAVEEVLFELLDYIEENDINVLFVDTPHYRIDKSMGRANTVYKILEQRGFDYVNYCLTDEEGNFLEVDMDPKKDYYDEGHTNYNGAEKFTDVFMKYLDEHYDLPDRRNDEAVKEEWDGVYGKILNYIAELKAK